jgi:predicted esterase
MTSRATAALLRARPHAPAEEPPVHGSHPLLPGTSRPGVLLVPPSTRLDRPAALAVLLHGAGGNAASTVELLGPLVDALPQTIWLFPESIGVTWDVIPDDFGPDVARLEAALGSAFDRFSIDPARIAVAGFSDGATYALSVGLSNGELFPAIMAFSPGFHVAPSRQGKPRVFVSHGTKDEVLPIDRTSRPLVDHLMSEGYAVTYVEFDGPHAVPADVQDGAARWLGWTPAQAEPGAP